MHHALGHSALHFRLSSTKRRLRRGLVAAAHRFFNLAQKATHARLARLIARGAQTLWNEKRKVDGYEDTSVDGTSPKARMARKLRSKTGSAIYAKRKAIVEPVNGQIKEARGLRRFLLRGLEKVDAEWHLIAATHNLLKLFRYRRSPQQARLLASG